MTFLLTVAVVSIALFLLSVPVAFALGLSCIVVMVLWPGTPFLLVAQKTINGMDSSRCSRFRSFSWRPVL